MAPEFIHRVRWVRDSVMTGSVLKQFATIVSVAFFLWRVDSGEPSVLQDRFPTMAAYSRGGRLILLCTNETDVGAGSNNKYLFLFLF